MITLQTLLSLASIGFFWAPAGILDLTPECLGHVGSFDEGPSGSYATHSFKLSCFKMFRNVFEFQRIVKINEMIERCQSAESDVCNFFYILDDKERDKLCLDLKNWAKLLKRVAVLCYKYRETKLEDMPIEGQDIEDLKLSESYREMYDSMSFKEERYYKGQLKLLKFYGLDLKARDIELNSTTSTTSTLPAIPEGSEYESESEAGSDRSNSSS